MQRRPYCACACTLVSERALPYTYRALSVHYRVVTVQCRVVTVQCRVMTVQCRVTTVSWLCSAVSLPCHDRAITVWLPCTHVITVQPCDYRAVPCTVSELHTAAPSCNESNKLVFYSRCHHQYQATVTDCSQRNVFGGTYLYTSVCDVTRFISVHVHKRLALLVTVDESRQPRNGRSARNSVGMTLELQEQAPSVVIACNAFATRSRVAKAKVGR